MSVIFANHFRSYRRVDFTCKSFYAHRSKALSIISSLVESLKWTIVVPLPVIMELDGLSSNPTPQLAEAASSALNYLTSRIRSHTLSLKVQTSKGNYLTSLNVRTEEVDFSGAVADRSMDDLILKAAIWQDEHWVDRSSMLNVKSASPEVLKTAEKVVFLSLDRNRELFCLPFLDD